MFTMARPENRQLALFDPQVLVYTAICSTTVLGGYKFYTNNLRRISRTAEIPLKAFRRRFLVGKVTSVGDGDNFHFYHLPGGVFAGWGWLRKLPRVNNFRGLKNKTLSVRLCGVDAPERAHFGKPAQPFSEDSLIWLKSYILGKKVYVKPLQVDQYGRVVGKVKILKWNGLRDVSEEMIRYGIGVVYEGGAKFAEFDGKEAKYKKLESRAKSRKLGLWGVKTKNFLTPGEYKRKYA
ncbi:unnamed protein product [Kuraishia capsulata CBS 1993]|uniref:Probable endonuclease LCL3 n=1 Tax=Kuraishia capsulata CBS 1993 TaxID=1382522 RepID=W6MR25_9ASCO|nr:uncharacterized protein KUCA_T00004788001 [Kuraishia capsulata CBS 1993]CDK28803.1 unnamed protein product [Kuraishia capsulata CBS 1993]